MEDTGGRPAMTVPVWAVPTAAIAALLVLSAALASSGAPAGLSEAWAVPGMVALGAAASVLASMVGLGGGLIMVPVLIFLGIPPQIAAANSLVATMANAAGSTMVYARQKRIDYHRAVKLGLMAVPGSVLGAVILVGADPGIFGVLLAAALVAAAVYVFLRPRMSSRPPSDTHAVMVLSAAASFLAGVISAYFGVGGGVIFVPLMVIIMGMSMMRAAPTSMLALMLTSIAGVITHGVLGHADMLLAALLSAGALAGGMAGARLSLAVGERHLRVLAAIVMVGVASKLVWDSVESEYAP